MIELFQSVRDCMIRWVEGCMLDLDNVYNTMGYGESEAEQLMNEVVHYFILMPLFYLAIFPFVYLTITAMYIIAFIFGFTVALPVNTVLNLLSLMRKR